MKTSEPYLNVGLLAVLTTVCSSLLAVDALDVQHTVVHFEPNKHCGMPAFHGAQQWQWGDEILTAYNYSVWAPGTQGDPLKPPTYIRLARSTDGGLTWTHYDPPNFDGDGGEVSPPPAEGVDVTAPGFAFKVNTRAFPEDQKNGVYVATNWFHSTDKGASWKGPFAFAGLWQTPALRNAPPGGRHEPHRLRRPRSHDDAGLPFSACEIGRGNDGQGLRREDARRRAEVALPVLDCADLGAGSVDAVWFDPRNGTTQAIGRYTASQSVSLAPPSGWEDAVLCLNAVALKFVPTVR